MDRRGPRTGEFTAKSPGPNGRTEEGISPTPENIDRSVTMWGRITGRLEFSLHQPPKNRWGSRPGISESFQTRLIVEWRPRVVKASMDLEAEEIASGCL